MSNIKVPYILKCQVTGIQKSYTSVPFVERKIENYGGDEAAMIAGYVCRDAKKLLKAFKLEELTVDNVQSVITQLGGTTNAQEVFDNIKSGKLFLKKMVKHREKPAAPVTEAPVVDAAPVVAPEAAPAEPAPVVPEPTGDKVTAGATRRRAPRRRAPRLLIRSRKPPSPPSRKLNSLSITNAQV